MSTIIRPISFPEEKPLDFLNAQRFLPMHRVAQNMFHRTKCSVSATKHFQQALTIAMKMVNYFNNYSCLLYFVFSKLPRKYALLFLIFNVKYHHFLFMTNSDTCICITDRPTCTCRLSQSMFKVLVINLCPMNFTLGRSFSVELSRALLITSSGNWSHICCKTFFTSSVGLG